MEEASASTHVIGPAEKPVRIVREVLQDAAGCPVRIIDLSAAQLDTPGTLRASVADLLEEAMGPVEWIDGQRFAPVVGDTSREAYVAWLARVADEEIDGGRSIQEWFTYWGELSLWWFTEMAVGHSGIHPYRWLFYMVFCLGHALAEEAVGEASPVWHLWTRDAATARVLRGVVRERRVVKTHVEEARRTGWARWRQKARRVLQAASGLAKNLARPFRAALFGSTTQRRWQRTAPRPGRASAEPLVLVHTLGVSWDEANVRGAFHPEGADEADHYFGDAPWRLAAEGFEVAWLPRAGYGDAPTWERRRAETGALADAWPWMVFPWRRLPGLLWAVLRWAALYVWLFEVKQVHDEWRYRGLPMGAWLKDEYRELCLHEASRTFVNVEQYRSAARALDPDAVLYRNEFYAQGRRMAAALTGRAHLVGVQHGMISREHTLYQFDGAELGVPGEASKGCPAPDAFASFGAYYEELFEHWGGYSAERVLSTGGLRHDALVEHFGVTRDAPRSRTGAAPTPAEVRCRLGLPTGVPLVLLCTGRAPLAGTWFGMVAEAVSTLEPPAFVAVKTHQYQGGGERVRAAAQQRGFDAYRLFDSAVYPLLFCADVVVGGASTITTEARLLGTPAVAIVAQKGYQTYPFEEEGVAHAVSSSAAMTQALHRALGAEGAEAAAQRKDMLRRHLRNHDAGACRRLAAHLKEILSQNEAP